MSIGVIDKLKPLGAFKVLDASDVAETADAKLMTAGERASLAALPQARASGTPGKNLFNHTTTTTGKVMGGDGVAVANANYAYSAPIPVTAGIVYSGVNASDGSGMRFVTFFTASGAAIPAAMLENVFSFTAPANAASVVISILFSTMSRFQFEIGSEASAFEAHTSAIMLSPASLRDDGVTHTKIAQGAVSPAKTSFLVPGKNLFNKAAATLGYFVGNTGGLPAANATLAHSEMIPVEAGQPYYGRATTTGMRFVTFYDANRTFVAGGLSGNVAPHVVSFTPPEGAAYVIITVFVSEIAAFQLEASATQTAFETFAYVFAEETPVRSSISNNAITADKIALNAVTPPKVSFLVQGKNLFDKTKATIGFFRGHDGSTTSSATHTFSDFIAVTPGQQLVSNQSMRFTTFYSAAKALIAGGSSVATSAITVPPNVYFVVVTQTAASIDTFQLEVGTASTTFEAYGFNFTPEIIGAGAAAASSWSGKTWATLGDSITASATWQLLTASALGLSFTNLGIGGTKISGAVGDTNAMCQDTRINAIATTFDLITLMGGTNDWAQNVALGAVDATDPTTFNGALNTWANKAFTRWPSKRLAVATTPYGEIPDYVPRGWSSPAHNTLGLTTNDYAAAIRAFAARRNIALIDVALNAGWGTTNIQTALGGSATDHLHPAAGSNAAKGIAATYRAALRMIEP